MTSSRFRSTAIIIVILIALLRATPVEAQTLLVSNYGGGTVNAYNSATGAYLGAFVANGSGGLTYPHGLALGPDNKLYVAAYAMPQINRYDLFTGDFVDAFTSGDKLQNACGLAFGPGGYLYVADALTGAVVRFDATTGAFIDNFVTGFGVPIGVMIGPEGDLYVCASTSVYRFNAETGAEIGPFATGISQPNNAHFGPDGNLYVTSYASDEICEFDGSTGDPISTIPTFDAGGPVTPYDLAFRPDGDMLVSSYTFVTVGLYAPAPGGYLSDLINSTHLSSATDMLLLPTVIGHVYLQGTENSVQPVQLNFRSTTTGTTYAETVTLAADGSYTANVPPDSYEVLIVAQRYLDSLGSTTVTDGLTTTFDISLLVGDVNGDNLVDVRDFSDLSAAYGSAPGDANWNPAADLNNDGVVDTNDFNLLTINFGHNGASWPPTSSPASHGRLHVR